MNCGRVIGIYDSRLIEYDPSTLAPLGLIAGADELTGKTIVVVGSGVQKVRVRVRVRVRRLSSSALASKG